MNNVSFTHGTRQELEEVIAKNAIIPLKCDIYLDVKTGRLYFVHDEVGTELTINNKNDIIFIDSKGKACVNFQALHKMGV